MRLYACKTLARRFVVRCKGHVQPVFLLGGSEVADRFVPQRQCAVCGPRSGIQAHGGLECCAGLLRLSHLAIEQTDPKVHLRARLHLRGELQMLHSLVGLSQARQNSAPTGVHVIVARKDAFRPLEIGHRQIAAIVPDQHFRQIEQGARIVLRVFGGKHNEEFRPAPQLVAGKAKAAERQRDRSYQAPYCRACEVSAVPPDRRRRGSIPTEAGTFAARPAHRQSARPKRSAPARPETSGSRNWPTDTGAASESRHKISPASRAM